MLGVLTAIDRYERLLADAETQAADKDRQIADLKARLESEPSDPTE